MCTRTIYKLFMGEGKYKACIMGSLWLFGRGTIDRKFHSIPWFIAGNIIFLLKYHKIFWFPMFVKHNAEKLMIWNVTILIAFAPELIQWDKVDSAKLHQCFCCCALGNLEGETNFSEIRSRWVGRVTASKEPIWTTTKGRFDQNGGKTTLGAQGTQLFGARRTSLPRDTKSKRRTNHFNFRCQKLKVMWPCEIKRSTRSPNTSAMVFLWPTGKSFIHLINKEISFGASLEWTTHNRNFVHEHKAESLKRKHWKGCQAPKVKKNFGPSCGS